MENKLHSFERPRHFELEKKLWELTGKNVRFSGGYFESEKNTVYQYLIYNDLDSKKKIYFEPAEDAYVYSGDMDKYYDCLISQINVAIQEIEVEDEERRKNSKDRKVMIYGPCPPDHTHEFKKEYVGIRKSKLFNDNKDYMMFNLTCDCGMASGFDFEDIDEASNEC
jgi:hypothetical protein